MQVTVGANRGQFVPGVRQGNTDAGEKEAATRGVYGVYSVQDFWLRKHFIQKHFEAADMFVSPSEFLRQRYVDWGIPADFIRVIENGVDAQAFGDVAQGTNSRNRILFVGSMNYHANMEGAQYFVRTVWPMVHAQFPQWRRLD